MTVKVKASADKNRVLRWVSRICQAIIMIMLVTGIFLLKPSIADESPVLSNGAPVISGQIFSMTLLSGKPASHEDIRGLEMLARELDRYASPARSCGMDMSHDRVKVMLILDLEWPCRDLYLSHGAVPDANFFKKLYEDTIKQNDCADSVELSHYQTWLDQNYPYLYGPSGIPRASIVEIETNGEIRIFRSNVDQARVEAQIKLLQESLNQPISKFSRQYNFAGQSMYMPCGNTIFVRVRTGSFHRSRDEIMHEFGHHIFQILFNRVSDKHQPSHCPWTRIKLSSHIMPENELFADFFAVNCGFNPVIELHDFKGQKITEEQKRKFNAARTMSDFVTQAREPSTARFFVDPHNILSPMRSLLWRLRKVFGNKHIEQLVTASMEERMKLLLVDDVKRFGHTDLSMIKPGMFVLENYPDDIVTTNQRYYSCLTKTAQKLFSAQQMREFSQISREIMGKYMP